MVNSYRALTQSYIKTLYRQTSNLALYNQDCPKETQLTSNAYTLNLVKQDRLSARYQSQCLKQALECLSSIDNKQTEQDYVLSHQKRKAKCPVFKGYPQLDSKFVTIQFKTDDPTLLKLYPTQVTGKVPLKDKNKQPVLNEQDQPVLVDKLQSQSVQAISSAEWNKQQFPSHYDLCIRLSRPRGRQITQGKSIVPILLKQNSQFKHWLHYQKELGESLVQRAILIPFVEVHSNKIALDFDLVCFQKKTVLTETGQCETQLVLVEGVLPQSQKQRKKQDLTPQWVYNLSGKPMSGNKGYAFEPTNFYPVKDKTDPTYQPLTPAQKQKRADFIQLIQSLPEESIFGLDVGWAKLGVLSNHTMKEAKPIELGSVKEWQSATAEQQQSQALVIGSDHRAWLLKVEQAHQTYQQLTGVYRKSGSTLHRKQKAQAKAVYVKVKQHYHDYIKKEIGSLPWHQMKVLVIENLNSLKIGSTDKKNLGVRFNKRNAQWACDQVMGALLKKAQEDGIYLVSVSPQFTSKQCPLCGIVPETKQLGSNRRGETYHCRCCTLSDKKWVLKLDSDYVGSHNIRLRLFYWLEHHKMPYQYKKKVLVDKSESDSTLIQSSSPSLPDGGDPG